MKILEALCEKGAVDRVNEDAWGHNDKMLWVLDGATGLVPHKLIAGEGSSDARWLAQTANDAFSTYIMSDNKFNWSDVLKHVSDCVQKEFKDLGGTLPKNAVEEPFTAVRAIYHDDNKLMSCGLSDCVLIVEAAEGIKSVHGDPVHHDIDVESCKRAKPFLTEGLGFKKTREKILDVIQAGRAMANTDGGYWVFGLRPNFLNHLQINEFDVLEGANVLVMSDGFYRLVDVFGLYTDETLLEAVKNIGLSALYDELRDIEDEDDQGERYTRLKKADDVTVVWAEL